MQPEASTNGDDDTTSSSSVQIVVAEQRVNDLRSNSKTSVQKDRTEIGWTEKYRCVICNGGGKLLQCSESDCPISLHEECMKCPVRFDGMGNFFCPYCRYKRAVAEECEAKKKVMMLKDALPIFLNGKMVDGDQEKQYGDNAKGNGGDGVCNRDEEMENQSETAEPPTSLEAENGMQVDDIQQGTGGEDQQEAVHVSVSAVDEDSVLGSAVHVSSKENSM